METTPSSSRAWRLGLLGGFRLSEAWREVSLPMVAQRLLAFLALQGRPVRRAYLAGTLWIDATDERAAANLRSALWKMRRTQSNLVLAVGESLQLAPHVTVDLADSYALARLAIEAPSWWKPAESDVSLLSEDVLPTWYDEWVVPERERYRQLRLHGLESLCERLTARRRFSGAIQAGLAAVAAEPLRESAQRALIAAFLAEGNAVEAMKQYASFRRLLHDELGLEPSSAITELIRELGVG